MGAKSNLLKYLDLANEKKKDFYLKTKLSNGFLDKNENISSNNIEIIISVYRDLNLYWLITGEGEMLRDERPQSVGKKDDRDETKELLREKIKDQQKIIELLEEKVEALKGEIALQEGVASAGAAG
ncbi:MAG: hypothetical protein KBT57_03120 [bacterium]|nr:hypothetical protein [Candidatus Limimorpha equi]